MDRSFLVWLLLLGLGFPLLAVVLGEAATHLDRRQHPLAQALRYIRNYLLLPLAALLVMQQLLELPADGTTQVVATLTLLALMVAGTALVNGLLTTQSSPKAGQIKVPNLFFQVSRGLVVLGAGYFLITGVWQIDLSGLLTAVGVGSLVIALALQDTLSNLVSGLLLLIASPFKVGDWIDFGGAVGRVSEQNWWSVTVLDQFGVPSSVPNGTLAKATIKNFGQEAIFKTLSFRFSYDDPPNDVISVLGSLVDDLPQAELEGARVVAYDQTSISYLLCYFVLPEDDWDVTGLLLPRIYYAAKRHRFTIPYPIEVQYNINAQNGIPLTIPKVQPGTQSVIASLIPKLSYFANLEPETLEEVIQETRLLTYGTGELILQEDRPDDGLYILAKGQVRVFVTTQKGQRQELGQLEPGDTFGETAVFPGEVSMVTAVAKTDAEVAVIPDEVILDLIQTKPKFATDMVQFLESGKNRVRHAKGITSRSNGSSATNKTRKILLNTY